MRHPRNLSWAVAAVAVLCLALPSAASAVETDDFPTDPQAAMEFYESDIDEWADGPVAWILLEDEKDLWDELSSTEEKQELIAWFWDRRDPDLRDDANPVQEEFYARVAHANERFNDFPRGWKSDRGRIFIVLGPPESVRALNVGTGVEGELWTYLTVGPRAIETPVEDRLGEFDVAFVLEDGTNYTLADDRGIRGTIPRVVRDALDLAAKLYVVNPDLELGRVTDRGSS